MKWVVCIVLLAGCAQVVEPVVEAPVEAAPSDTPPRDGGPGGALEPAAPGAQPGNDSAETARMPLPVEAGEPFPGRPHVVIGSWDNGLNVYHEQFYHPERTDHPCTYIEAFPCWVRELPLSVGTPDLEAAIDADRALLDGIELRQWYWIPQTPFVAVMCKEWPDGAPACFLPYRQLHGEAHATGTMSAALQQSPDALVAFVQGGSYQGVFADDGIPVDVWTDSHGTVAPLPAPRTSVVYTPDWPDMVLVQAAGNDPYLATLSAQEADPDVILVSGAYDEGYREGLSRNGADMVSHFCMELAEGFSVSETGRRCGTSFAAPAVAGAVAEVILRLRQDSGYAGQTVGGVVEPGSGVTVLDLREALNMTASYAPPDGPNDASLSDPTVPVPEDRPWTVWYWGFYDGRMVDATIAHLLGQDVQDKPQEAKDWMAAWFAYREAAYSGDIP